MMPGATATERFRRQVPGDIHGEIVAATPLGRLGEANDIADVVSFWPPMMLDG